MSASFQCSVEGLLAIGVMLVCSQFNEVWRFEQRWVLHYCVFRFRRVGTIAVQVPGNIDVDGFSEESRMENKTNDLQRNVERDGRFI